MEKIKKSLTLSDEYRMTLQLPHLLHELRSFFPKVYNLRYSISHAAPVWCDTEEGVLYELQQDSEDNWPQYLYVLWSRGMFRTILRTEDKADYMSGQGLFFIVSTPVSAVLHTPIFSSTETKMGRCEIARTNISSPRTFHSIDSLQIMEHGVYVVGKHKDEGMNVAFIKNTSFGVFEATVLESISIPDWLSRSMWHPGYEGSYLYAAQEKMIYTLPHYGKSGLIEAVTIKNPEIQLGKTHEWLPVPDNPFTFMFLKRNDGKLFFDQFSTSTSLPQEIELTNPEMWIPFADGFVTIRQDGSYTISITYYSFSTSWHSEILYTLQANEKCTVGLIRKDSHAFYIHINDAWYKIQRDYFQK